VTHKTDHINLCPRGRHTPACRHLFQHPVFYT